MEHIKTTLGTMVSDQSSLTRTLTELQGKQTQSKLSNDLIAKVINEVQVAVLLKPRLNDQEILYLTLELAKHNWTEAELRRRAESVKIGNTYGSIAYKYWIQDLVCTRSELEQRMYQLEQSYRNKNAEYDNNIKLEVDRRLKEYRRTLTDPSELKLEELAGANDAIEEHQKKKVEARRRAKAAMKRKLALVRQQVVCIDNAGRRSLLDEAVKRGKITSYDETMVTHAYHFPELFVDVVTDVSFMSANSTERIK